MQTSSSDQRPLHRPGGSGRHPAERAAASRSSLFIVPAGKVAVVTTLGKVSGGSRLPGLNFKIPLVQAVSPFDVRTQVRPEEFATPTKDLQVIEATATVKYAVRPDEAGRIYRTIASTDREIYPRIIQPSLLKALKSVLSSTNW